MPAVIAVKKIRRSFAPKGAMKYKVAGNTLPMTGKRSQRSGPVCSCVSTLAHARWTAAFTIARRHATPRTPMLDTALDRQMWSQIVLAARPQSPRSSVSLDRHVKIRYQTAPSHVENSSLVVTHARNYVTQEIVRLACRLSTSVVAVVGTLSRPSAIKATWSLRNASVTVVLH